MTLYVETEAGEEEATAIYVDLDGVREQVSEMYVDIGGTEELVWSGSNAGVTEGFEDGTHDGWDRWDTQWSVTSGAALGGTNYGAKNAAGSAGTIRRHGDNWFPRGTTFEYLFRLPAGHRLITMFAVSTTENDNHYEIWNFANTGETRIVKDVSGSGNQTLTSASTSGYNSTDTFKNIVTFDASDTGNLSVVVENATTGNTVHTVAATDTELNGDGIGHHGYASGEPEVDEYSVL